jgi:hypothetical protein
MNMKHGRIAAIAAALTVSVAQLIGISGASPAAADPNVYHHICSFSTPNGQGLHKCAYSRGAGIAVRMANAGGKGETNYYYPNRNTEGQIREANTNLCLQVNASDGNAVREADCGINDAAEKWLVESSGTNPAQIYFVSAYFNIPFHVLSYDAAHGVLRADLWVDPAGGWYQFFFIN